MSLLTRAAVVVRREAGPVALRAAITVGLTALLAWVMKPDFYGLLVNGLDPVFYTGYSLNLNDSLVAAGDRHYFVSRWSAYLPVHYLTAFFDPYWARLVWRLALLVVIAELFWRLGRRLSIPPVAHWSAFVVVVTSPVFVRSFTTDYVDHTVLSFGLVLTLVALCWRPSFVTAVVIGVCAAMMGIAYPLGFLIATVLAVVWFVGWAREIPFVRLSGLACVVVGAVALVLLAGHIWFRVRFGVGAVYEPTLRFLRDYVSPIPNPWVTESKSWFWHFPWIYLGLCAGVLGFALGARVDQPERRMLWSASAMSIGVLVVHLVMDFRQGQALESNIYFGMGIGPVLVLLWMLLVRRGVPQWAPALAAGTSVLLLIVEVPQRLRLGAGVWLFIALAVLWTVVWRMMRNTSLARFAPMALAATVVWMQVGAPEYNETTPAKFVNKPYYDVVYRGSGEASSVALEEILWFMEEMDRIPDDALTTVLPLGPTSFITAVYQAHVSGRMAQPGIVENPPNPAAFLALRSGFAPHLTVLGPPDDVAELLDSIRAAAPGSRFLLDKTHSRGMGMRLVVMDWDMEPAFSVNLEPARGLTVVGTPTADGAMAYSAANGSGAVVFGPYTGLTPGRYRFSVTYDASGSGRDIGAIDVTRGPGSLESTTLVADGPGAEVAVEFEVKAPTRDWEFRVFGAGDEDFVVTAMRLEKLD